MRYLWIVALVFSGCGTPEPPHEPSPDVHCVTTSPSSPCVSNVDGSVTIDLGGSGVATLQGTAVAAPATKEDLLRMLRALPPGDLLLLGYAGADGDVHQLSEADLRCQQP